MQHLSPLEWIGYLASVITAVSLLMNSIVRLRWFNLFGSALFCCYGVMINALPVALFNGFIVFVNIFYIVKLYRKKNVTFSILAINADSAYLRAFLAFYKDEIQRFFPEFHFQPNQNPSLFFILSNMVVAGIFIGIKRDEGKLEVQLDFAVPEYRDFRLGRFFYTQNREYFKHQGITTLVFQTQVEKHQSYLKRMGFKSKGEGWFEKVL